MTRTGLHRIHGAFVIGPPPSWSSSPWFPLACQRHASIWPNRDYWFEPGAARRDVLSAVMAPGGLASLLVSFLCYAHALVVLANGIQPPRLPTPGFIGGLVASSDRAVYCREEVFSAAFAAPTDRPAPRGSGTHLCKPQSRSTYCVAALGIRKLAREAAHFCGRPRIFVFAVAIILGGIVNRSVIRLQRHLGILVINRATTIVSS